MLKKILAVAVLGCALLASQAFAYETGEGAMTNRWL